MCQPAMSFKEFALSRAAANEQFRYAVPLRPRAAQAHGNLHANATRIRNAFDWLLRVAYLAVGTTETASTIAEFCSVVGYAIDAPWKPEAEPRSAHRHESQLENVLANSTAIQSLDPTLYRAIQDRHWLDSILFEAAKDVQQEQRRCYEILPIDSRSPSVRRVDSNHSGTWMTTWMVPNSSWWKKTNANLSFSPPPDAIIANLDS